MRPSVIFCICTASNVTIPALAIQNLGDVGRILAFGLLLDGFLYSLFYIFNKFGNDKAFKQSLKGVDDAMKLVALSGGILLAGSLLMRLIRVEDLVNFTVALGLFIGALSLEYLIFASAKNNVFEGAEGFGKLVAMSGATLILGALLYRFVPAGDIIGFGFILSAFILAISGAYALAAKIADDKTLEISKDFAKLVAISGATLLIGGLVMTMNKDLVWAVPLFAVILGVFVAGISIALGYAAKISDGKALSAIGTIGVVTFLVGGLLLFAGYLIGKNPGMLENILAFSVITALFVLANVGLIALLSQIDKTKLLGATLALVGIGALGLLMGFTMNILSDVADNTDIKRRT